MANSADDHTPVGRGSPIRPQGRFRVIEVEDDLEQLEEDEALEKLQRVETRYYDDESRSIISENDSLDIPFRYSLNPYRGCLHGCSYCYARPTHEYFGLSAGLDFESVIFVKLKAAALFREWLCRDREVEPVMFSGVTDCYQPAERRFRLTRACLEVALEARCPIGIVTKNALVTRDIDLLRELAADGLVRVAVSLTTLDQELGKVMEPRTSAPHARLRALSELAAADIPTHAMLAPVIPGLNDSEIPQILEAAANHGARSASYIVLRLPQTVEPVFLDWLARHRPSQRDKVENRLRSVRAGALNDPEFGRRMRGQGAIASQIASMFQVFAGRHGLLQRPVPLNTALFRPPMDSSGQQRLF